MTHRCFAVVHVLTRDQACYNCELANELGFDGVFLISHDTMDWVALTNIATHCERAIPYVGANFIDLEVEEAIRVAVKHSIRAIWSDRTFLGAKPPEVELFSGFAFKYRPPPVDFVGEAREAVRHCDVLTTSGPATGQPATVAKVQALREAVGPAARIGLASGITPENVLQFLPYVNDILVATGINFPGAEDIDPDRAERLLKAIRSAEES